MIQYTGQRSLLLPIRKPNDLSPTLRLQLARSSKKDPKEERNKKRTVASRQTRVDHKPPRLS
jgi:hypothetical protein